MTSPSIQSVLRWTGAASIAALGLLLVLWGPPGKSGAQRGSQPVPSQPASDAGQAPGVAVLAARPQD